MFKTLIYLFRVENNTVKASEMMQKSGYEIDFETHWSLISNMSSCKEKETRHLVKDSCLGFSLGMGITFKCKKFVSFLCNFTIM